MTERRLLLGLPLDDGLDARQLVERLISRPTLVSYLNPFAWKVALSDRDYPANLGRMDFVTCDGLAIRHAARVVLGRTLEIISMDESGIAPAYLGLASKQQLKVSLVGARQETISAAAQQIATNHPGIRLESVFPGFGTGPADAEVSICSTKPDLVLAGMGMGRQERFLLSCRKQGWQGSGICVGAFFERLANPRYDYPEWSKRLNSRFLGNLARRPGYYVKRYGVDYWPFLKQYGAHVLGRRERTP